MGTNHNHEPLYDAAEDDTDAAHLGSATATRELVPTAAATQAPAFNRQQLDIIKSTLATGLSDNEFALYIEVARRTGLDPLSRQIYAIKRGDKLTIQTGIDGYRAMAARTGLLAGIDDAIFDTDDADHPNRARVTVWRYSYTQERVPFTATARWSEYKPAPPNDRMWSKMPYLMLGKCAEALALRKAFPVEIAGVYTHEEMAQADDDQTPAAAQTTSRHARAECSRYAHEHGLSLAAYQRAAAKYADDDALWDALHEGVRILEEKRREQAAVTVTEADPEPEPDEPQPEPDEPPSDTKKTRTYSMLGDVELRARADRLGYKTVDAIELLLARAGLAVETATRAECEAALHAEELRAAAVLGPTNPVGSGKSGARGGTK